MATTIVTVGEYKGAKATAKNLITTQILDISSGEAASSAFNASTRKVRISSDVAIRFLIGDSVTAAVASDQYLGADQYEYHDVDEGSGWVVSAIQHA